MSGPLPSNTRRRRNAPAIPTTNLPAEGCQNPTPDLPERIELGPSGLAWWEWAWHTPQAAAWDAGMLYVVTRRASLEDDLAALAKVASLDAVELSSGDENDLRWLVERLAALATSRLTVCREMRELDDRLGLTPKAMAQLRWKITGESNETSKPAAPRKYTHLRSVSGA